MKKERTFSTIFSTLFGGIDSPKYFWHNIATI